MDIPGFYRRPSPWVRTTMVAVEDIDVDMEQENPDTWMTIINFDGSGEYSEDGIPHSMGSGTRSAP